MESLQDTGIRAQVSAAITERIEDESHRLPYRWGYVQGVLLFPWSLLFILGATAELVRSQGRTWYLDGVGLLMGLIGVPLGFGLLRKRTFAFILVHVMFALSLLLALVKLPIAITHFTDFGDTGSAMAEALNLMLWLFSLAYYRRRKAQFQ